MLTIQRLSLDDAKLILAKAEEKAHEMGIPMCIAVTDESGQLLAFHRMDGAKVTSVEIAINKAFTAAGVRRGTHEFASAQPGGTAFGIHSMHHGRIAIFGGGLPVTVDGAVVGAVGCSSGTAEEDRVVAQAGIDAFLASLQG